MTTKKNTAASLLRIRQRLGAEGMGAYIAGLFDGEGYVGFTRHTLRVSITNTQRPLLAFMAGQFGGSVRAKKRPSLDGTSRPCYEWYVGSLKAAQFLRYIGEYLILKKAQVTLATDMYAQGSALSSNEWTKGIASLSNMKKMAHRE